MEYSESIRKAFREYLSDENSYKNFVHTINGSNDSTLSYVQEKKWNEFLVARGLEVIPIEKLSEIFGVCYLHEQALVNGEVEAFFGHLNYSKIYLISRNTYFPFSNSGPVTVDSKFSRKVVNVWYCKKCREAEALYKSNKA